jgi:chloramphenicol O-acetyltransferase type B
MYVLMLKRLFIVTRNVPPYTIMGSNPAREIKPCFNGNTIERLLALNLYQLSESDFEQIKPHLKDNNIAALEPAISQLGINC